jgi:hypothetical protein
LTDFVPSGFAHSGLKLEECHKAFVRDQLENPRRPAWMAYRDHMARPTTVNQSAMASSACQLNANPRIIEYKQAVQAEIAEKFMGRVELLIAELEEARQIGIQIKAPGPMVAATMGKAKLYGLDRAIEDDASSIVPVQVIIQVQDASAHSDG